MKLRFPGLGELLSLFVAETTVSDAIAGLRRAQIRLASVVATQQSKAKARAADQAAALKEADRLGTEALAAQSEADHAQRVAARLEGLCA